jgi:hypothetical protein
MNYLQLKLAQMRIRGLGCHIYFSKSINAGLGSKAAPRQGDHYFKNRRECERTVGERGGKP